MKRTEGTIRDESSGEVFKVSKGAPHVLLKLVATSYNPDHHEVEARVEEDVIALGERGIRCLAVAKTDAGTDRWRMMGLLTFLDPPRPDTKQVWQMSIGPLAHLPLKRSNCYCEYQVVVLP